MLFLVKGSHHRTPATRTGSGWPTGWLVGLIALAVVAFVATRGFVPAPGAAAAPHSGVIAVVGAGEDDPLWPVVRAVALAQQPLIPQNRIVVEAPPITSINAQHGILRRLRDEAKAVCVHVIDPLASRSVLEQLRASGVIVVTMGPAVASEVPFLHVGWSEGNLGEQIARTLVDKLPEGGMLALLKPAGETGDSDRALAMRSELRKFVGLRIIVEYECSTAADARAAMIAAHRDYPAITGWISLGNWPLQIDAEEAEAILGKRLLVAADATPATWPVIERDLAITVVTPNYAQLASAAVARARDVLMGRGDARDRSPVELLTITRENLGDFRQACLAAESPAPVATQAGK
jgi:ABC-type sugar transport system substrate-binding protein